MRQEIRPDTAPLVETVGVCPFHSPQKAAEKKIDISEWVSSDLRCSAGKREFNLGRYTVAHVEHGWQFVEAFDTFKAEAIAHRKTGFLAIVPDSATPRKLKNSVEELRLIGKIMVEAGYAKSLDAIVSGDETVAIPVDMDCPVTGTVSTYEFFPVAFCRHAANVLDPLYDPSLSAPFLAINTTSDAFAFAMLVKDLSVRKFGMAPFEIGNIDMVENLLFQSANVWQNMSVNTIKSYNKAAERKDRAVYLSDDQQSWYAPHNDPVFAEMRKDVHEHEMPVVYANRLCQRWIDTMFHGAMAVPARDGQSGGLAVKTEFFFAEQVLSQSPRIEI